VTGRYLAHIPASVFVVDDLASVVDRDGADVVWTRSLAGTPIVASGSAAQAMTDLVEVALWER
jgi:hypothetical protein